jgi:hypothetical protein
LEKNEVDDATNCWLRKITYGGWEDEWWSADVGDTWHGDKAKSRRCSPKKALLLRLSGDNSQGTEIWIKLTRGTGRQEGEDGDWVGRRAERNKFEFAKDLMERDSEENSGRWRFVSDGREHGEPGIGRVMWLERGRRDLEISGMTGCRQRSALCERERIRCFSLVAGLNAPPISIGYV